MHDMYRSLDIAQTCARVCVSVCMCTQTREAAFLESADLFAALVARPDARRRLLRALATLWALHADAAADRYDALHIPAIHVSTCTHTHTHTHTHIQARHLLFQTYINIYCVCVCTQDGKAELVVGRAVLDKTAAAPAGAAAGGSGTFARTGHALRLMERAAVALARHEPLLLVGETGTGKTTLVSRLAAMTGSPLVSFNMSAQVRL